jgi:hypothetical protein
MSKVQSQTLESGSGIWIWNLDLESGSGIWIWNLEFGIWNFGGVGSGHWTLDVWTKRGVRNMEGPLRGLLAGAAAWKFGGGCLSTIVIFILVFWLLGYVHC